MAKAPRLSALKEADLEIKDGPVDGRSLRESFRRLFGQLNPYFDGLNGLGSKGITLTDNIRCDVAAGKFSHGVAATVALQQLERAGSVIALGADGAIVACQPVLRVTGRKKVEVTVYFNDVTAKNVPMKLLFLEEGQPSATVPTYSAGSSSSAAGWATALDLDISAQPLQAMGADGNYTIGGLTVKRENAANDAVAMALINGQGLVIQPNAASDFNNATRTCPLVWISLSQLGIPNLSWSTGIRVSAYVSAANYAANYDNSVVALDGDNTQFVSASFRGIAVAGAGQITRRILGGVTTGTGEINVANTAANNVQSVLVNALGGSSVFAHLFGQYAAGWPADSAMGFAGGIADAAGFGSTAGGPAAGNAPGNYGVVLGALRAGSGTALSVTFARLKVEYRL
jgi:hypothetical protein